MNKVTEISVYANKGHYVVGIFRSNYRVRNYKIVGADKVSRFNKVLQATCTVIATHLWDRGRITLTYSPNLPPQEGAERALAEVCQWLQDGAPGNTVEPTWWDDDNDKATVAKHTVARKMAKTILTAADVDGLGGCLLCCN